MDIQTTTPVTPRKITVASRVRDPKTCRSAKYSNDADWNKPDGQAPNGVAAFRALRDTQPDPSKLSPFAAWLVENLPNYVAGNYLDGSLQCCSNLTVFEWEHRNNPKRAEAFRRFYGTGGGGGLDAPKSFEWKFSIINAGETDEHYWNAEAKRISSTPDVDFVIAKNGACFKIH